MKTRLVAYDALGAYRGVLPNPLEVSVTSSHNDLGVVSVHYDQASPKHEYLDNQPEIAVQTFVNNAWVEIRNTRTKCLTVDLDHLEEVPTRRYDFIGVGEGLKGVLVYGSYGQALNDDGKVQFTTSNPGRILSTVWNNAVTRGWSGFSYSFSATHDSAGVPWNKTFSISYSVETNLLAILAQLVSQGTCDYDWDGRTLNVYNANSYLARDLSLGAAPVRFYGTGAATGVDSAPEKQDVGQLATHVVVLGEAGLRWEFATSTIVPEGRRETILTFSGVNDIATAQVLAEPTILKSQNHLKNTTRQFHITPQTKKYPFTDYRPGDWAYIQRGNEFEKMRIFSINIQVNENGTQGYVVLGDKVDDLLDIMYSRIQGLTGGIANEGAGPIKRPPLRKPSAPYGINVTPSSVIASDGTTQGLMGVNWSHDGKDTQGETIDLRDYLVYYREKVTGPWEQAFISTTQSGTYSPLEVYDALRIKLWYQVRIVARSTEGVESAPSAIVEFQTVDDVTPPPKPTTPAVKTWLRTNNVRWDGKGLSASSIVIDMPADFSYVKVWQATTSNMTGKILVGTFNKEVPMWQSDTMVSGTTYWYALSAVDWSGNESALSTSVSVTPTNNVDVKEIINKIDAATTDITNVGSESIKSGAILNDKLADNAVTLAKIADATVSLAKLDTAVNDKITKGITDAATAQGAANTANTAAGTAQTAADAAKRVADAAVASGANLATNGGFETDEVWAPNSVQLYDTTEKRGGARSMKLIPANGNVWPIGLWVDGATDRTYRFEYWVKKLGTDAPINSIGIVLQAKTTAGGTATIVGYGTPKDAVNISTTDFTKVTVDYTVTTANTVQVRFAPWVRQSTNVYWVDDFSVTDITDAKAALAAAATAQAKADTAFTDAQTALTNAGLAQSSANGKTKTYYTSTAPAGSGFAVNDVWFRSTDNRVHLWDGTSWVARADTAIATAQSAATSASTAAATADSKAVAAQTSANSAQTAADGAQTSANNASTLAQAVVKTSTSAATGTPPAAGALWNQTNTAGDLIINTWTANSDGTAWVLRKLDNAVIGNLNAATINAGFINAARFNATDIRTKFLEAGKVTAADIVAGTLTSASGVFGTMDASVINAGTLNAARLLAGDVRAKFLAAGFVTAADMVTGTITAASGIIGSLDIGKVTVGELDGIYIKARTLGAKQIIVSDTTNLYPDPYFKLGLGRLTATTGWTYSAAFNSGKGAIRFISSTPASVYMPMLPDAVPVTEGSFYHFAIDVAVLSGTIPNMNLRVYCYDKDGANNNLAVPLDNNADKSGSFTGANGSYQTVRGTLEIPSGTVSIQFRPTFYSQPGTGESIYLTNVRTHRAMSSNLLVDGAVTADKVEAVSVAAKLGSFMEINVSQLRATTASMGTAVIDKLWTDVVRARRITTDMLVVGRGVNGLVDEFFEDAALKTLRGSISGSWGTWARNNTINLNYYGGNLTAGTSQSFFFDTTSSYDKYAYIPVEEGQKWRLSALYLSTGNGPRAAARIIRKDGTTGYVTTGWNKGATGTNVYEPAGTRVLMERIYTVPADVAYILPAVQFEAACTSAYVYGGATFTNMTTSSLLVEGAVTAKSLTVDDTLWAKVIKFKQLTGAEIDVNTLTADTAWIGTLRGGILINDAVTTTVIKADAITSKHTITGATLQTVSTALRGVKISTSLGIMQYDDSGNIMVRIGSGSSNLIVGDLQTSRTGQPGIKLINSSSWGLPAIQYSYEGNVGVEQAASFMRYTTGGTPELVHRAPNQAIVGGTGLGFVRIEGDLVLSLGSNSIQKMRVEQPFNIDSWSPVDGYHAMSITSKIFNITASNGNVTIQSNDQYTMLPGAYNKPTGVGGNVYIAADGGLFRSTSASKYKIDPVVMGVPEGLLEVPMKHWLDLHSATEYSEYLDKPRPFTEQESKRFDTISLDRIPGAIAEDVEAAGGEAFVTYGSDGQVEGLMYDRFALARTALLLNRIKGLESRLEALEAPKEM